MNVKIRLGISTKLIFMVTLIVLAAIGVVVSIASDLFKEESISRVQETNKDVAESLAEQSLALFRDTSENMTLIAETVTQTNGRSMTSESRQFIQNIMRTNDDLLTIGVYRFDPKDGFQEIFFTTKDEVLAEFDTRVNTLRGLSLQPLARALNSNPDSLAIVNTSYAFKKPVLTVGFLTKESSKNRERWLVKSELRQDRFIRLFQRRSMLTVYLIDIDGNILVHSNPQFVIKPYNVSSYPIVQKFKERKINNQEMEFSDDQGNTYLGAFKTLGIGNTAIVAQIESSKALAAVMRVQYRALLVTAMVIGLAFILNFIFSKSMTSPLGTLYAATEKISEGNFDVKLEPKGSDEIGALTFAFKKMASGLQERDRLKSTFSKFHSKEIAQKILSGEIKLGGERKMATVFFSDIREFTAISENMSPDEVLGMLNEYMTEMVKIIYRHDGVVDKYVGDAIMALWGIPHSGPEDAYKAVLAALHMRRELRLFNKKRKSRNQPEIKVGMGIHTGEVVAGNMGSDQRLEYTVIGDNVNQASRIESATKELDSDILISDSTWALVKSKGILAGPVREIHVKGKAHVISVHQVIGYKDAAGSVITDLSVDEQNYIMNARDSIIISQTTATTSESARYTQPVSGVFHRHDLSRSAIPIPEPGDEWYLVRNPASGGHEGPFTTQQLKVIAGQAGFPFEQAYVFKEGDSQMTPMSHIPSLSRRVFSPNRPINAPPMPIEIQAEADLDEWYIYGDESTTYGPYSVEQIRQTLEAGNIVRTTYVWRQGMDKWIYVYQIPGFDRRGHGGEAMPRPVPVPLVNKRQA